MRKVVDTGEGGSGAGDGVREKGSIVR